MAVVGAVPWMSPHARDHIALPALRRDCSRLPDEGESEAWGLVHVADKARWAEPGPRGPQMGPCRA